MLGALDIVVPILLALSLASERLVTIVKTVFPWLTEENKTEAQEVDLVKDRPRRLMVQFLAIAASWVTTSLLANSFNPFASLVLGQQPNQVSLPLIVVAILASGGSALWNNILGYTKAVKDTKQVEKASSTLSYHVQAEQQGVTAVDSGNAARGTPPQGVRARDLLSRLREGGPPSFTDGGRPLTPNRNQP